MQIYELKDVDLNSWHHVSPERELNNPYDCNAVVVHAISSEGRPLVLRHVEKQAAEWLSFFAIMSLSHLWLISNYSYLEMLYDT